MSEVVQLRIIAERLNARGEDGIAMFIYYAAELLERPRKVSPGVMKHAIAEGERAWHTAR